MHIQEIREAIHRFVFVIINMLEIRRTDNEL
jgi:hypothetical protein